MVPPLIGLGPPVPRGFLRNLSHGRRRLGYEIDAMVYRPHCMGGRMNKAGLAPADIQVSRQGSGPPLVLLPCLGVDHRLWDIAAAGLERDFTLISYDFPGHGETPLPGRGYSVEDLSAQLAEIMAREGIAR